MTSEELEHLIQNSVREALSEHSNPTPKGKTFQPHEYLSIEEASIFLKRSISTLYSDCHNNSIPFYKRGKFNYFLKSELDEWLASGRKKTAKEIREEALSNLSTKGGRR
ncbi:helix-turn-helix domain-containing protein [Arcicella aurantiaca]|nr:helix-turn-helix domain-containing protein [Arcicella aurantiaca]